MQYMILSIISLDTEVQEDYFEERYIQDGGWSIREITKAYEYHENG